MTVCDVVCIWWILHKQFLNSSLWNAERWFIIHKKEIVRWRGSWVPTRSERVCLLLISAWRGKQITWKFTASVFFPRTPSQLTLGLERYFWLTSNKPTKWAAATKIDRGIWFAKPLWCRWMRDRKRNMQRYRKNSIFVQDRRLISSCFCSFRGIIRFGKN